MKGKIKQKGFIQIPLLIGIIISLVTVSALTTGVIFYKQGKLPPLIANVSKVFKDTKQVESEIKSEEFQSEERSLLEEINQTGDFQAEQELEQAKLEVEKVKQEAEQSKAEQEAQRIAEEEAERLKIEEEKTKAEIQKIKAEQKEVKRLAEEKATEEEALLKVEKCKSEYNLNKQKLTYEIEERFNILNDLKREIEERMYQDCVDNFMASSGINFSTISGETFSSLADLAKTQCEYVIIKSRIESQSDYEKLKNKEYLEIEQELQSQYQDCLTK